MVLGWSIQKSGVGVVAVTASTGDSGYGAQFPATSPHVIAVGGTTLTVSGNSRGWSESAWSGGGSGCSALYAEPTWQVPPPLPATNNMSNNTMCTNRMEADVSAVADPNTGVAVYAPYHRSSAWLVFGGTSVGAPLIGGIFGEKNDSVNYAGNIYSRNNSTPSDLYDIASGNNGNCGLGYYCTAIAGYDGPTGLGTPNGDSAF